jgi:hypothetical protein
MRKLSLLLALAALLLVALHAQASLTRAMDLSELTASADQVVVADVAKVTSQWDGDHRNIITTVEIAVQESWKGSPPSDGKLRIRQLGGTVGDIEMTVIGMPRFSVGEHALLFLQQNGVVGMGQGKRPLRWDTSEKRWLVERGDTAGAVRLDQRGKIRAEVRSTPETLDSLRDKVRALLGK